MRKIWINGVFDILHRGHIELIKYAMTFNGHLCIGIDSDIRVKQLKGESRPINNEDDRKYVLENINGVNEVVIFETKEDLDSIIKEYNPDLFIIGSDYKNKEIIGKKHSKEIIFFERIKKYSSTFIINKL